MASAAAARGPLGILLQTSAGQYCVLGLGFYTLFPEKFQQLSNVIKLVASNDDLNSKSGTHGPIIIHTPSPTVIGGGGGGGQRTWVGTITYAVIGAGACWAGYMVAVQVLPDAVSQFLPVTRSIFDKTSHSLGKGILTCKQVLEEKISFLSGQTEGLSKKQDETNKTVSHIKSELGEARMDLTLLQSIMQKCEGSLENSEGMQQYTLRGVRLLVRCVANMLPNDVETVDELARFIEEEQNTLEMLSQGPQSPESDTLTRPMSQGNNPVTNVAVRTVTPNTTIGTPVTTVGQRRQPLEGITTTTPAPAKRSLSQRFTAVVKEDEATDAFTDIRSLLGH